MKLTSIEKSFLRFIKKKHLSSCKSYGYKYFYNYIDKYLKENDCMITIQAFTGLNKLEYDLRVFVNAPTKTDEQKDQPIFKLSKINSIYSTIVQLIYLIDILEKEKIITTYSVEETKGEITLGNKTISMTSEYGDPEIAKKFFALLNKSFVIAPEFTAFSRLYLTKLEKRHLGERFLQYSGLIVAIVLGVLSFISSREPVSIETDRNPVQIIIKK